MGMFYASNGEGIMTNFYEKISSLDLDTKIDWLQRFVGHFKEDENFKYGDYITTIPLLIDLYYVGDVSDLLYDVLIDEIDRFYDEISKEYELVYDKKIVHFSKFVRKKNEPSVEQLQHQWKKTVQEMEEKINPDLWGTKNCSKCGIKLDTVMGYCCPRLDCPTGLGPTIC